MIIIGDKNIPCDIMEKINSVDDIKNTQSNSTLLFDFDFDILKYTQANELNSAVRIKDIKEIIYASTFGAKYIIPSNDLLNKTQNIANNYMFDSKILASIRNDEELEQMILEGIDGIIYED